MTSTLRRFAAAPVLAAWDILLPVKQTWWALFGIPLLAVMHWLVGALAAVTGEGSLDHQSLRGKAAVGVSRRAGAFGIPTYAVAGVSTLAPIETRDAGLMGVYTLSDLEPDRRRSMSQASDLLALATERLTRASLHSVGAD